MSQLLDRIAALPPDKRAALAEMLRPAPEPIAVVGIGCRFAGADSPAAFWNLLEHGRDLITEVPGDRWDIDAYYDPDPDAAGKVASRWGSFIDGVDRFDAHFFGIGTHEAARMDPHQRLLLEVAWEALEHGGINPQRLARTATGVFLGAYHSDFTQLALADEDRIDLYSGTGTSNNVLAGRLSYFLDLRGPSVVVDTACSSGLVAVQLACQSLRNRECEMALAGGVTVLLTPLSLIMASRMGLVARDGRCKTFDARADGIVMGDGCGVVVLKRLSAARADGDQVLAVIRGVAVNQDGRTNGLTAPNVLSQQTLLRNALRDGGVEPGSVTYIEAHGTGTSLGDPIEVEALTDVVGQPRADGGRCAIGSIKTNIGHVGAAAGIAGLIKVVLSLQHQRIAPHLNFTELNPNITLAGTPFYIPQSLEPWPAAGGPRRAGVNAFGWSGTNAHAVLEEAPAAAPAAESEARPRHLLFLSAMKISALEALAGRYEQHFREHPDLAVADVCHTAAVGRAHLPHRLAVQGASLDQIADRLSRFRTGERGHGIRAGEAQQRRLQPVFLFTGQGSQYVGMGKYLYRTQPTFRRELDRCDELLQVPLGRSIVAVMHGTDASPLDDTLWSQPALFALGWSLAALWRSWGVTPAAVLGHSVGELVAACVAGMFGLEDGLALVSARARLVQLLPRGGLMAAVFAPEALVAPLVARQSHLLAIAAINGPEETVISGDADAVRAALDQLAAAGVRTRLLAVSHAFHSPHMDAALDALEGVAASLRYTQPVIPIISSVTGALAADHEMATGAYWRRQLRAPVRFADGIRALHERGHHVFFEIGPRPTLSAMARRCLPEDAGLWLASLDKEHDDWEQMLDSLGTWYAHGGNVNFDGFEAGRGSRRATLPTYPFQRERYPLPTAGRPAAGQSSGVPPQPARASAALGAHPLLGTRVRSPLVQDVVYESRLGLGQLPYLDDHRVYGSPLLPMTGYVDMVLAAAADALGPGFDTLADLLLEEPMIVGAGDERVVQVVIRTGDPARPSFQIYSRAADDEAPWTRHVAGGIRRATDAAIGDSSLDLAAARERCTLEVPVDGFYQWLDAQGLHYGPGFRGLREIAHGDGEAFGQVCLPDSLAATAGGYRAHPAQLDACDQVFAAALPGAATLAPGSDVYLPLSVEAIHIARTLPAQVWSYCRLRAPQASLPPTSDQRRGAETLVADILIADEHGVRVAAVHGLLLKRAARGALAGATRPAPRGWLHQLRWQVAPALRDPAPRLGAWVIVADAGGAAALLARRLEAQGNTVVTVTTASSFAQHGPNAFALAPAAAGEHRQLWQAIRQTHGDRIAGVVHMAGLDAETPLAGDVPSPQGFGCASALHLLQAIVADEPGIPPPVSLVTRGAQAVDTAPRDLAVLQASLWGLGRTVALEHPALRCRLIDLDPQGGDDDLLHVELVAGDAEPQIAFRGGVRFVARLAARAPLAGPQTRDGQPPVRSDRTYLVTGGLSGIGLRTARWLAGQGARHLVLVGRSQRSVEAARAVAAMEHAGARVVTARADVSRASEIGAVIDDIRRTMPPLAGIVHSAGVIDDATLSHQTWDRFERVMAPKVSGALHLDALTRDLPLDFFVLFSSIAACFGSPGQANYAAANACLDALAHQRRASGLPALSINWGAWSDTGMAARLGDADRRRLADRGLGQMQPEQALQALGDVLRTPAAHIAIMPIDWATFLSQFTAATTPPLYALMASATPATGRTTDWSVRLAAATPAQQHDLLRELVAAEAASALGLDPAQPLDPQRSLYDVGLNSLIALDLTRAIGTRVGRALPATMLFNYSTVEAIVRHLIDEQLAAAPAPAAPPPAAAHAPSSGGLLQHIEALSDDEVDRLLASKARR